MGGNGPWLQLRRVLGVTIPERGSVFRCGRAVQGTWQRGFSGEGWGKGEMYPCGRARHVPAVPAACPAVPCSHPFFSVAGTGQSPQLLEHLPALAKGRCGAVQSSPQKPRELSGSRRKISHTLVKGKGKGCGHAGGAVGQLGALAGPGVCGGGRLWGGVVGCGSSALASVGELDEG